MANLTGKGTFKKGDPRIEEECPYEEKRMALGWTVSTDEPVWLRKLKKVEENDK